jgi:hypothetical protein
LAINLSKQMLHGTNSNSLVTLSHIDMPPDFNTFKEHRSGLQRADDSSKNFNDSYFVSRSNSYVRIGPPSKMKTETPDNPALYKGRNFMTCFKDHSEAGRIAKGHISRPLMSGAMKSIDQSSHKSSPERALELGFRNVPINTRLKSSWQQLEPVNPSLNPYIEGNDSFKPSMP